ncbi:hypothetical protein [Photobacterium leiognathi]|uniref:Uncharacterized protein n=1 Tax=Photobacterium leiognathi TaxID=553611 RepID=A0A2T3M7N3_PHOLE|nr:hypothetical protein [Photobacterium leiognathi]KJF93334.1 hypothetical protein UB34_19895 [Photobacterium leiognathi]PSV88279.1 hypothetical protein CTM89_15030 [Photobacterium leiognathi]
MSKQLLNKLKNDKDFALYLQKRTLQIEGGINIDRKRSIEMIANSPEQLEKLEATFYPPKAITITITTFITTTTPTTLTWG